MGDYPGWVCRSCAQAAGGRLHSPEGVTWHIGKCDVCGKEIEVTAPRDFGYPKFRRKGNRA